ncbi:uncharacterized protein BT62DRAFT_626628 [Guyanagaster necrorhizus]|uniref:Uncharacterized protein n=1 Tax=Guyanagaster necrorhizus TaxID=856835 RepID=A0A9P7VG98_9AGAR|nr:uncharacterized protein BT62DRAFT_626628 [Guyanagaster necrorhizus MCA 3950]KAG7440413.1 hypothetical protein BT62DRAFT_626628 [Guyanagaster necrorhizus MCA 3950]
MSKGGDRNSKVLRAALKHGGLIWRLAMEEAPEEYVISSPSPKVTKIGTCFRTTEGELLWNEMLTEDQIDVICGVYKVVEREEDLHPKDDCRGKLTERVSWAPKNTSWRGCGLDVGFWSPDAESWYQGRLVRYLSGDFKCENLKRSLKLRRDASKVAEGLYHRVFFRTMYCVVLFWSPTVSFPTLPFSISIHLSSCSR